eukprot:TRINITY_DN14714_c0_g1_i1.p1 TRINITY_DN14714_c0_g1~~TRINITY_DN14714_c0_g1_i1.p1  ORF type:complete len:231 (+),score=48.09 TRINITY_DN14714_c0_g1_i1:71-763(+)
MSLILILALTFSSLGYVTASDACDYIEGLPSDCTLSSNCLDLQCSFSALSGAVKGGFQADLDLCDDVTSMELVATLEGQTAASIKLVEGQKIGIPGISVNIGVASAGVDISLDTFGFNSDNEFEIDLSIDACGKVLGEQECKHLFDIPDITLPVTRAQVCGDPHHHHGGADTSDVVLELDQQDVELIGGAAGAFVLICMICICVYCCGKCCCDCCYDIKHRKYQVLKQVV